MNIETGKFDKEKNDVLVENNAQTIFDHLNELEKESETYAKRWFWELLQNAKDSVGNDSKVSVNVVLENNILTFSHTGNAFEKSDILHLIFHGSSKKSLEGKTGRFGTGFMSTHLLSRKVNIIGKISDRTFFNFELDREALDVGTQLQNLEKSYNAFCESNASDNYSNSPYNTTFRYELTPTKLRIASEGLNQLLKILPFVMAFNSKIDKIEVCNEDNNVIVRRGERIENVIDSVSIFNQEIFFNDKTNHVVFAKLSSCEVGVLVEKHGQDFHVIDLDETYPKIFFDFPLFGTERFGCPCVINSDKFDLKAERDGIYLGANDSEHPTIEENKKIISDSLEVLPVVIKFLSEQSTKELYNLFKIKTAFEYSWLQKDWINELYKHTIEKLIDRECLVIGSNLISIRKMKLPYSKSIDKVHFYELVTEFFSDSIPTIVEADQWLIVIEGFAAINNLDLTSYSFIIDEKKLCRSIEQKANLTEIDSFFSKRHIHLTANFKNGTDWLNRFFYLLSKEQTLALIQDFAILPNQHRILIKKDISGPYIDRIEDEDIKIVIENFGWDIKNALILSTVNIKGDILQEFNIDKSISYISNSADKLLDEHLVDAKKRIALIEYLRWLVLKNKIALIRDCFVIVEKGKDSIDFPFTKRRLFQTSSEKVFAPPSVWSSSFALYKELISKKYVLIEEYYSKLSLDNFKYLESEALIYLSPLVIKSKPSKNDLKLLVKETESYALLLNEKDELIETHIEFSDIPYLTRSDDNILAKTADSFKSAKTLLRFILSEMLQQDSNCAKTSVIMAQNDNAISVNHCLWIARLRDTQWVPIKSVSSEKQINSERPSVSNITELIKGDEEILNAIKTRSASLFFNQLGISVADIIRSTLSSEEERLKWDMTFSQLLTNGKINPDLAIEMLEDKNLQEVYLAKKEKRERIKANQNVGYLFEKIFREIFSTSEFINKGFSIIRKPIGSDFQLNFLDKAELVIDDQDILNEQNQEVFFDINGVLIELKATGKKIAEMTPTQAEIASLNNQNYILAVLPLGNYELNEETVKLHSRFVVNIAVPLTERFEEFKSYLATRELSTQDQTDVRLNIEDGNIRYQVKSDVWENSNSKDFTAFIQWVTTRHD